MKYQFYEMIADASGMSSAEINENMSFTNDLGLDSVDMLHLIMQVEKEFQVSITDEDYESIQTVGHLQHFL